MVEMEFSNYKSYQLDIEKLRDCSVRDLAPILSSIYVREDFEYFDEVEHLLKIPEPEPPKSLDEIQSELEEKIDGLISKYKDLFNKSAATATYFYGKKCDAQSRQFKFAVEYGYFPPLPPELHNCSPWFNSFSQFCDIPPVRIR